MTDRPRRTAVDGMPLDPIDYPWTPAPAPGLLHDGHFEETEDIDACLRAVGTPEIAGRHAVIAVGSNASPAVMHRKLAAADASTTVAFTVRRVPGVGVGHSAHVSAPGYIAAAPFSAPGTSDRFVIVHLDDRQLDAVDATEPNYRRVSVGGVFLYASVWGVLAVDGTPIARCHQRTLHRTLGEADPRFARLAEDHEGEVSRRLAHDGTDPWRHRWRELGFVRPDGLHGDGTRVSPPPTR